MSSSKWRRSPSHDKCSRRFRGRSRNYGRSHHPRQHEAFDCHAFKRNRQEECVQMPVKIARSTPRPSFGLRELLVASHISRLASRDAAKSLLSTLVSESSGECRMKQTFFMSLFLIAAMSLSACSKMSSLSSPIRNSSLTRMCRSPASGPSWEYGPVHKVVCSVLRSLGVDEPLWDDTIWNNPLPDYAYPGPVPIHRTYYSQSMNVNVGYNVLLPPEYDGSTRFPVIYMFGGGGSDENTYLVS